MRPQLNNVCVVSKPEGGLPDAFVGSSEWLKLEPKVPSYFLLLALRSRFVREQLGVTGGQTRPRVQADRVANVKVPVPSEAVQEQASALLDTLIGSNAKLESQSIVFRAMLGDAEKAELAMQRDGAATAPDEVGCMGADDKCSLGSWHIRLPCNCYLAGYSRLCAQKANSKGRNAS